MNKNRIVKKWQKSFEKWGKKLQEDSYNTHVFFKVLRTLYLKQHMGRANHKLLKYKSKSFFVEHAKEDALHISLMLNAYNF